MSLRIGRLTGLNEPSTWQSTGDRTVVMTGSYKATSLTDGLVKRDQILAYAGNVDEPIIPITIDGEARINGYYRVTGAHILTDEFVRKQGNLYDYQLDLEAVPGFAAPQFESIITGGLLNNVVGGLTSDYLYFHAYPTAVTEYNKGVGGSFFTRSSADGSITLYTGGTVSDTAHFYLTPPNFYVGAATLEQGSPLQPVVGRQLAQNDVTNWRASNGLVRVTPYSDGTYAGLNLSWYNGTTWSATKLFLIRGSVTAGYMKTWLSMTVLRNSVEEVVIRLGVLPTFGINWGRVSIDVALRRGDRIARCYLTADAQDQYEVSRNPIEASTAITYGAVTLGGIRATAFDASGNRFVLLSYQQAVSANLTNGLLLENATLNTMDFGLGAEVPGGAFAPDDPVSIAKEYLAVQGEKQTVVSR